jgi:hypothetical protein
VLWEFGLLEAVHSITGILLPVWSYAEDKWLGGNVTDMTPDYYYYYYYYYYY